MFQTCNSKRNLSLTEITNLCETVSKLYKLEEKGYVLLRNTVDEKSNKRFLGGFFRGLSIILRALRPLFSKVSTVGGLFSGFWF